MKQEEILKQKLALALDLYVKKKYKIAKEKFQEITNIHNTNPFAYFMLGSCFVRLNDLENGQKNYEKVIAINPTHIEAYNSLGIIFKIQKKYKDAMKCFKKTISLNSQYFKGHYNLGNIFELLGEYNKAKISYKNVININLNFSDAYFRLGSIAMYSANYKSAEEYFKKTIDSNPNHFQAYNNMGIVLTFLDNYKNASENFKKSLEINPNYADAQANLTNAYLKMSVKKETIISESFKCLKMLNYQQFPFPGNFINKFRLKHDVGQAELIASNNFKVQGIKTFIEIGNNILINRGNNEKIYLDDKETNSLLDFYRSTFIYKIENLPKSYINSDKNWKKIEDEYLHSKNQITYIDNFLSEECLFELRKFCLLSKVWLQDYKNGYLGSFVDRGFISPLHLKIAEELNQKLPKVFGKLVRLWGFKYDTKLGKGINIHADAAIANLNFWITPDEFHNNKEGGGLKVYDAPAPDNWHFNDYNDNPKKIYEFLKEKKPNLVTVPYRYNRAVLFNSAYFHETDQIDFVDKYEGRRINVTYLFGERSSKFG